MKKIFTISTLIILPKISFGAATITTFLSKMSGWLNSVAILIIGLTVIAIFWGIFQMIFSYDKKAEEGKNIIMWGIIALFVMVSLWGIVGFLQSSTGLNSGVDPKEKIKNLMPTV